MFLLSTNSTKCTVNLQHLSTTKAEIYLNKNQNGNNLIYQGFWLEHDCTTFRLSFPGVHIMMAQSLT